MYATPYAQPQMQQYGILGDLAGAIGAPAGRVIGNHFGYGQLGEQIGGTVGAIAKQFSPYSAIPQAAPIYAQPQMQQYGILGDLAGAIGAPAGRVIGNHFGYGQLGEQIGGTVGALAQQFSPYSAVPMAEPVYAAPQNEMEAYGIFGNIAKAALPGVGRFVGRALGNERAGATVGNIAGTVAGFLPFSAYPQEPQMQQYGVIGDLAGAIGAPAGRVIGNHFGYGQLGEPIGSTVGTTLKTFLPFSAVPGDVSGQMVPTQPIAAPQQLAPYGIGGAILGAVAPAAGEAIGGLFGNKKLGRTIGSVAGTAMAFLPFSVGPGQVAYLPVETGTVH